MDFNAIVAEQVKTITASLTDDQLKTVKNNAVMAGVVAAVLTIAYYKLG